ncbi:MAG TPA: GGDEF domain-containing protein [Rhizomicrobium sp.]
MNRHDRAQAFANAALALMVERGVAPTPKNYELFYAFTAGENPAVARVLGGLIETRKPFTPEVLADLHERFFATGRIERAVDDAGADLFSTVNEIAARLGIAKNDAVAYGRALSDASGELGAKQSPEELRKLVGGLISSTQAMEMRTKALEADLEKSSEQVSELKSKLDDVRKESLTDPLTGLANRKSFDTELDRAIAAARATSQPLTVCMVDIDRFKNFNDKWGHQTGDRVLRQVADCLSENVKGRDTAARYGGEEFVIILPQTSLNDGMALANKIRQAVETKKLLKKSTGTILDAITISVGATQLDPEDTAASVVERADVCLYAAKKSGRNRVIGETAASAPQEVDAA